MNSVVPSSRSDSLYDEDRKRQSVERLVEDSALDAAEGIVSAVIIL